MLRRVKKLRRDARGSVAIAFAFAIIPIAGAAGVAIDYSRASHVRAELQATVDAAALAGGKETSHAAIVRAIDAEMSGNRRGSLARSVTYKQVVTNDTVRVEAKADVETTISRIFLDHFTVRASATAQRGRPVRQVSFEVDHFNADAWDANSIYWYVVPEDDGIPKDEDLNLLLSNDPATPGPSLPTTIQIGVNDVVGFAMVNVTGGMRSYGNNSYGQPPGSVHKFYSHKSPENMRQSGHVDCTLGTTHHAWDDNGGGSDDNDYNDATYDYSCKTVRVDPGSVFLTE
jgi:hypothetical protein